MLTSRSVILPARRWEILERFALRGPFNPYKIAKSEIRSSTVNQAISNLDGLHLIKPIGKRLRRKREVTTYAITPFGLTVLLTAKENWRRLEKIFTANQCLIDGKKIEIYFRSYRRNLLDAWELTRNIPDMFIERVIDYYSEIVKMQLDEQKIARKFQDLSIESELAELTPGPCNLLLRAIFLTALMETSPDLMFQVQYEKREIEDPNRRPTRIVLPNDLKGKLRFPEWFRQLLKKAYKNSELYGDLLLIMKMERDQFRVRTAIISQELRRLPALQSALQEEFERKSLRDTEKEGCQLNDHRDLG
jgi:hypothetical protein